jgi:hypothetical protein
MSFLKKIFGPSKRIRRLAQEIDQQSQAVNRFLESFDPVAVPYYSGLNLLLYWEKDKDHRYINANPAHCTIFFNLPIPYILGKTDPEIIKKIREKGEQHTFGELCFSSDEYVKNNYRPGQKPFRFKERK